MKTARLKRSVRVLLAGAAIAAGGIVLEKPSEADASHLALELSFGDTDKGFMTTPIYRGGAQPDEFLLLATPGNCEQPVQISMSWDKEENWARIRIQGKNVMEKLPSVDRTEGVDFFPNQFWPEPVDFDNGRYLLWFITQLPPTPFFYDGQTLELLGSIYDFPAGPPANAITIALPMFAAIPSPFFQPDENGDVDVVHEYAYDAMVRPDLPQFTHVAGTFIPHTLCKTDPYRYDRTSTRPYAVTLPAELALTWGDYIENGLVFDITVEPPDYFTFPPLSTNVGVYQGNIATAGGVPKGWTSDFEAIFGSIAPPNRRLPTAPGEGMACTDYYKPKRDRPLDLCAGPPPGGGSGGPGGAP